MWVYNIIPPGWTMNPEAENGFTFNIALPNNYECLSKSLLFVQNQILEMNGKFQPCMEYFEGEFKENEFIGERITKKGFTETERYVYYCFEIRNATIKCQKVPHGHFCYLWLPFIHIYNEHRQNFLPLEAPFKVINEQKSKLLVFLRETLSDYWNSKKKQGGHFHMKMDERFYEYMHRQQHKLRIPYVPLCKQPCYELVEGKPV